MQDFRSPSAAFSFVRLILSTLLVATFSGACLQADAPVFRTLAGGGGSGSADGSGGAAQFASIAGIAVDGGGNVYVADSLNHTVRRVSPTGVVTTVAGLAGQAGSSDGVRAEARFNYPVDVAADKAGNLYVCDYFNFTIRKITPDGTVSTYAGMAGVGGSEDGVGSAARFGMTGSGIGPAGIAIDSAGNVFVSDPANYTIRRITPERVVTTWAGKVGESGTADGTGGGARFAGPRGLAVDSSDNLYVADRGGETIRKITPGRVVTTLAGSPNNSGSADGVGDAARFSSPLGVAVSVSGSLYVADWNNNTVRLISSEGAVTTLAGTAGTWGYVEGAGAGVRFNSLWDVAVDANGYLYVADSNNGAIRTTAPSLITTHPASQVVAKNESVVFQVATVWPDPSYQWNHNGLLIPGATSSTLVLRMVGDLDVGTYTATITNGATTVTSNPATLALSGSVYAIPYQFTTIAGRPGVTGSAGGSVGKLSDPYRLVQDSRGNFFIPDYEHKVIRKITPTGVISTYAGALGQSGATDGAAENARFTEPSFLAIDKNDNLYVSDYGAIRKITPGGFVSTVAGVVGLPGNVDGTGASARVNPTQVAIDGNGVIYFADPESWVVRRVSPSGVVSLLAGHAGVQGNSNGTGAGAWFRVPYGVAVDAVGTVFVADVGNHNIRKITPSGVVSTFAGSVEPYGQFGDTDATGTDARFHSPASLWMSAGGDLYVGDMGGYNRVRKVSPSRVVSTLFATPGTVHQSAIGGILQDKAGNFFLTDPIGCFMNRIAVDGTVSVFAGHPGYPGVSDSDGPAMLFNTPSGLAIDRSGKLIVADMANHSLRRIVPPADSFPMVRDGSPRGVATDRFGNTYTADNDHVIRRVDPAGVESVFVGTPGYYYYGDGVGSEAGFRTPTGVAVDSSGNVYVTDRDNSCIRRITPAGVVTTFAGSGSERGSADGPRLSARFMVPSAIAVDSADSLYVADTGNHKVRKISVSGEVTTLAGSGQAGSTDGNGAEASFYEPQGIVVDMSGNVFLADTRNQTIRRISPAGTVTTVGGWTGSPGAEDGIGSSVRFSSPVGIAVDAAGNLYVADSANHTIRKGVPVTPAAVNVHPVSQITAEGRMATFFVRASGTGAIAYGWQISTDGGISWNDLSDGGDYSGIATASMSVNVRVAMSGNRYRCVVRNFRAAISAGASLTVVSPFAAWRQQNFGTITDSGDAANTADPDNDGQPNLLEYAWGTNPLAADTSRGMTLGTVADAQGNHLTLTFNRIADPALSYTVEASDDLASWISVWTSSGMQNEDGTITVSDSATVQTNARRFLRLKVNY
jgi:sugar lactone lactonase YvrE